MVKSVIYQILVRAFGLRSCEPGGSYSVNGSGKFAQISDEYLRKLRQLSVGYVWYSGVISHDTKLHFKGVNNCKEIYVPNEAGNPYAIRNYFDVDPALAVNCDNRMSEFQALIERTHKSGMKVIIDFIPDRVYREYIGYFQKNNFKGRQLPSQDDDSSLEETVELNYDDRDTWIKMRDILMFWASKGIDGFFCHNIEKVPAEFFAYAIEEVKERYRNVVFMGETENSSDFREYANAGFEQMCSKSRFFYTLKDILAGIRPARDLSTCWRESREYQSKMFEMLESGSTPRVVSGKGKSGYPALAVSLLFGTAPFLIHFGQEFGESEEVGKGWCIVPSVKRFLQDRLTMGENIVYKEYCRLMRIATGDSIFSKGKTIDLMPFNPDSDDFDGSKCFAWIRHYADSAMMIVANFDGKPADIVVNVPEEVFKQIGIFKNETKVDVHVNARDYMRIDLSR